MSRGVVAHCYNKVPQLHATQSEPLDYRPCGLLGNDLPLCNLTVCRIIIVSRCVSCLCSYNVVTICSLYL